MRLPSSPPKLTVGTPATCKCRTVFRLKWTKQMRRIWLHADLGGAIDNAALTEFVDAGHGLLLAVDSLVSESQRELAADFGVDLEPSGHVVIDHFRHAAGDPDHAAVVADTVFESAGIFGDAPPQVLCVCTSQWTDLRCSAGWQARNGTRSIISARRRQFCSEELGFRSLRSLGWYVHHLQIPLQACGQALICRHSGLRCLHRGRMPTTYFVAGVGNLVRISHSVQRSAWQEPS